MFLQKVVGRTASNLKSENVRKNNGAGVDVQSGGGGGRSSPPGAMNLSDALLDNLLDACGGCKFRADCGRSCSGLFGALSPARCTKVDIAGGAVCGRGALVASVGEAGARMGWA